MSAETYSASVLQYDEDNVAIVGRWSRDTSTARGGNREERRVGRACVLRHRQICRL
jgi:hypothetical protein